MNATDMVRETAYVKPGDNVENIGNSPQFEEGIAGLENANDVGDPIPVPEGFAIPLLVDKKNRVTQSLAKSGRSLLSLVKLEKARTQIEELARQVANGSASATAIAAAAQAKGLKASESKAYVIGSPLGEGTSATTSPQLEDAIYALKSGDVTKEPVKIGENYYIVGATKREEPSTEDFASQRDSLTEQMLSRKRSDVFFEFISSARQRMESAGQITIYNDALARIDAADAQLAPGGAPINIPGL